MSDHARLLLAIELYREALDEARDCCGCGEGKDKEHAADILAGYGDDWSGGDPARAERIIAERQGRTVPPSP